MMSKLTSLLLLALLFHGSSATAAVLDKSANGFVIESVVEVAHTPLLSYQQFLRVGEWWDGDHSWFGKAENFSIDARAGGCFCEINGEQQVQHAEVVFVKPAEEIRMTGGLGPLQAMAVHGVLVWKFEPLDQGGTRITHRYVVSGYLNGGLAALAEVVDKVQSSQLQRLQQQLAE